jgi:hypothetical protein
MQMHCALESGAVSKLPRFETWKLKLARRYSPVCCMLWRNADAAGTGTCVA